MASLGAWWAANIDPDDSGSTWPTLNPTGLVSDPETARWSNAGLTDAHLRSVINRVCNLAGVTPPTQAEWQGWSKPQKYAWLSSTRDTFFSQTGIWLDLSDNEGAWDDPAQTLAPLNLLPRQ